MYQQSAEQQLRSRLEEAEMKLEMSMEVNRHLNGEVEELVRQVDKLHEQNTAYEKHVHELATLLSKQKRKDASGTEQGHEDEVDKLANPETFEQSEPETSGRGESSDFLNDQRWAELRKIGQTAEWLVEPREVKLGRVLGEGTFGTTYRGSWRGGDVAVKCVRVGERSEAESFLREVATLAALRHPNIMPFYGACLKPPQHCWLLCEYLPGGTLAQWLHGTSNGWPPRRTLEERLAMALGVAKGMQALEMAAPPILHRDLKPSNVFIDAAGHPRVADMGLARRLTPDSINSLTGETGTYLYMAPEMIRHELYNSKADVFSWGVMLAELINQKPPYEGSYYTPVQIALAVGEDQLRPTLPPGIPEGLSALAKACYDPEPENRPCFELVVQQLRAVLAGLAQQQAQQAQQATVMGRMFGRARSITTAAAAALPLSQTTR
ncbi:hypothetical protein WJX72_011909 [[Myrmecia] bisecta]|uniref:Protein kinase domain-containing protein n=1 Tax=[Myrmecia] bisecta TaxID=41462 RepID=A0AAW1R9L0_9CHLO